MELGSLKCWLPLPGQGEMTKIMPCLHKMGYFMARALLSRSQSKASLVLTKTLLARPLLFHKQAKLIRLSTVLFLLRSTVLLCRCITLSFGSSVATS